MSQDPRVRPNQTYRLEFITKKDADAYLSVNFGNRPEKPAFQSKVSRHLQRGTFETTHQGIAFYEDGTLADGQNRLRAIGKTGIGAWLWVMRGLNRPTMKTAGCIDTGSTRILSDSMTMFDDRWWNRDRVAIGRAMFILCQLKTATDAEVAELLSTHRDAIAFSEECTKGKCRHACIRGVIARAYYGGMHDRIRLFMQIMNSMIATTESDAAAITLAKWLLQTELTSGGSTARRVVYLKVESGLRAFLDGRPLAKLYEASSELFPVPGESELAILCNQNGQPTLK